MGQLYHSFMEQPDVKIQEIVEKLLLSKFVAAVLKFLVQVKAQYCPIKLILIGDIFHGRLSLNQLFSARPVLGYGAYRAPLNGLYMCGSSTHPGGGVTGVPGHNAAREILGDIRSRRV